MRRFWTEIIKPIVEGLKPNTMIEIGVDKGENTRNILEYCLENKCKLISIDPYPDSSVPELKNEYKDQLTLIRDLSLNVLSDIDDAQVFFIDGDHNWYTVYNELKIIQDKAKEYFPLIFLHDVEWPYARRDLYYNPNDIPPEYINQYAKKGIDLHSKELNEKYGFNSFLNNALEVGTPRNGVFTAVEDFLNQTGFDLKFVKIHGFYGLGIIYDQNTYIENIDFKMSIDDLMSSMEYINGYIHKLSISQYDLINKNAILTGKNVSLKGDISSEKKLNKGILNQIKILNINEEELKQNIDNLDNKLLKKNKEIENLRSKLTKEYKKVADLDLNIQTLSNSRKGDFYKNFQILFSKYVSNEPIPDKSLLVQLSNIPYLFILLKSKGNIKKAWFDIKGYRAIKTLKLFDEAYYLAKYKSVLISGINPLIHYMYYGYTENKFPNDTFDGEYYLNKYKNVKTSGMNPLVHYSLYGINEGKKIK